MLDLFCGRWGWSKAFAARGWECVGVDLVEPPEIPTGCQFLKMDVLDITFLRIRSLAGEPDGSYDFICASPPCQQFSIHGMRNFYPDPKYPWQAMKLFNHARLLCEASGFPWVMENVRPAQRFVGNAVNHCGPFYLWGNAVPPILPQGIRKGKRLTTGGYRTQHNAGSTVKGAAIVATIPPELAACVADYATAICTDGASSQLQQRPHGG